MVPNSPLSCSHIEALNRICRSELKISGLFDPVLVTKNYTMNKILRGATVIHTHGNHYVLAENLNQQPNTVTVWDGLALKKNLVEKKLLILVTKIFVKSSQDDMKIQFPQHHRQMNGYECGDLCFAKLIELIKNPQADFPNIIWSNAQELRKHTISMLWNRRCSVYPKEDVVSSIPKHHFTEKFHFDLPLICLCKAIDYFENRRNLERCKQCHKQRHLECMVNQYCCM